jgi:hypothetical protein
MSARGTPLEDRHLLSAAELRAVLVRALEQLAPIGGAREIPFNASPHRNRRTSSSGWSRYFAISLQRMTERGRGGRTCG